MKKVLFYTETKWAFGAIHYGLSKELYKHNIIGDVLNWDLEYSTEEFQLLISTYDIFVTTPPFVLKLHRNYGVPLSKISAIAHGQWDILLAKHNADFDFYPHLHSFGVISNILHNKCKEWNFGLLPKVVETGINFDTYYQVPSNQLKAVGYGGTKETHNFFGEKIKRGHLVEQAIEGTELILKTHNYYNFLCMPAYYKSVDCVIMSSIEEAGGLPMLECAAAGRLPIGTPVGFFEENAPKGGGILVPIEENAFVEQTKQTILYYKDNPSQYINKCLEAQNYARENYDWSKKIGSWLELLS
jgi:glycosyltransferase involved in cell wall biosynthesis